MTVLRVGTTKKYSDNWDNIFSRSGRSSAKKPVKTAKQSAKKRPAKKVAARPAKKVSKKK